MRSPILPTNQQSSPKIAHLTSVHPPFDTRIFHKECKTLAQDGYEVVLIVPHKRDETVEGVRIRKIPKPRNRLVRVTKTAWQIYQAALEEDADLYHFHDPELIPIALRLQKLNRPIIYDVHEDYATSIRSKSYLPDALRLPLIWFFHRLETYASDRFELVLAERYYADRFSRGTVILNLPIFTHFANIPTEAPTPNLLYTGLVAPLRGAFIYAGIVARMHDVHVHVVGRCGDKLAEEMLTAAGDGRSRLHLDGIGFHVPYSRILGYYRKGGWLAGLGIFPPDPHYMKKEPTKFFEYMGAGIPIICSDFPVWRSLVESTGCGLLVDPESQESIQDAVMYLKNHPEDARAMGCRGRKAFKTRFNWESQGQTLLDLYSCLLGRRDGNRGETGS
jgi:glycosyltransferase involved in cell wall biosynthesis